LNKIRTVNNAVIERIYSEYLNSDAGKRYQLSSINNKFRMVDVCYSCYKFYEELSKEIVSEKGIIKLQSVYRLSDPNYYLEMKQKEKHKKMEDAVKQVMNPAINKRRITDSPKTQHDKSIYSVATQLPKQKDHKNINNLLEVIFDDGK